MGAVIRGKYRSLPRNRRGTNLGCIFFYLLIGFMASLRSKYPTGDPAQVSSFMIQCVLSRHQPAPRWRSQETWLCHGQACSLIHSNKSLISAGMHECAHNPDSCFIHPAGVVSSRSLASSFLQLRSCLGLVINPTDPQVIRLPQTRDGPECQQRVHCHPTHGGYEFLALYIRKGVRAIYSTGGELQTCQERL